MRHEPIGGLRARMNAIIFAQRASLIISPDDFRVGPDGRYRNSPEMEGIVWGYAMIAWRQLLELPEVSHGMLLIGPPGAGKSTCAETFSRRYRDQPARPLIFDATLSGVGRRRELVQQAKRRGKQVFAYVVTTPLEECLLRNSKREPGRIVPPRIIEAIHTNLMNNPPSEAEGFAGVYHVG